MRHPSITCYCEEDVPPFACFVAKSVMNPVAFEEPIMVVSRFGDSTPPINDMDLYQRIYAPFIRIPNLEQLGDIAIAPALPFVLTNGIVFARAKNLFQAEQPMLNVCWMRYDDEVDEEDTPYSDPYDLWFFPRPDRWFLSSTLGLPLEFPGTPTSVTVMSTGFQTGPIMFQRMGAPDLAAKCVPVVQVMIPFGTWTNPFEED